MARNKAEILVVCTVEQGTRDRHERWSLIVVSIESAEDPVQLSNAKGTANPRVAGIFDHTTIEMRLPESSAYIERRSDLELIFQVYRSNAAARAYGGRWIHVLALTGRTANQAEQLVGLFRVTKNSDIDCWRRANSRRQKLATDLEYRQVVRDSQKQWWDEHP